jgi:hypothetical protein
MRVWIRDYYDIVTVSVKHTDFYKLKRITESDVEYES